MIIHANSSLPRSGSELLQALLAQHPEIYASPTSPLLEYFYGAVGLYDTVERKSQDPEMMRRAFDAFCREGAKGYYSEITDKRIIVDKSRGWIEFGNLLWNAFPDAKIVCMVRKVEDIIRSLERIYQDNIGHPETRNLPKTAEGRANFWTSPGAKPLGLAIERLRERQRLGPDPRILYVDYDVLCREPVETMRQVFSHLRVDPINIDSENIKKSAPEDDSWYGIYGNHRLKPTISKS